MENDVVAPYMDDHVHISNDDTFDENETMGESQKYLNQMYGNGNGNGNGGRIEYEVMRKEFDDAPTDNLLYPHTSDPNFSLKIANKAEFLNTGYSFHESTDVEEFKDKSNKLMNGKMMFSPHQIFVRNFLSSSTPYNSLLLFHGLGSGKTLTSIGVSEQYRQDMRNSENHKTILVVASPNVQSNFKIQLFDERKLTYDAGIWTYDGNSSNPFIRELNPMGVKGLYKSRKKLVYQINNIINQSYTFMGYRKFTLYIEKIEEMSKIRGKVKMSLFKKQIETEFNDRLVIIDEIHNIKKVDGVGASNKRVSKSMINVIKNSDNMRLLLLSATPMYNDYKEIVWLLNMMNLNDGRDELYIKDIFDRNGEFNTTGGISGRDVLINKARGYISFVRGENPYTFPYRIFPSLHSPASSILNMSYPSKQMNGNRLTERVNLVDLHVTRMGAYQAAGYNKIKSKYLSKIKDIPDSDQDAKYNYSVIQPLIECLNFVFPNPSDPTDHTVGTDQSVPVDGEDRPIHDRRSVLYGNAGIKSIMTFEKSVEQHYKKNYEYIPEVLDRFGRIFSHDEIGKYSGKAKSILDSIIKSEGVSIVYSQYIDGGILPMALALEELGYKRYGASPSLFDPGHIKRHNIRPIDCSHRERQPGSTNEFVQASYAIISGDGLLSPNNKDELLGATDELNRDGSRIKVVFISKAGSESLDFKFIRNVFVMDPWYNLSRTEQIIGRAIRFRSHKSLEFEKRNTSIYLYCSLPTDDDDCETVDMYMYRKAETKAIQIGKVTNVLKEASVDCVLNADQAKFTEENMWIVVPQTISDGRSIEYSVGDKPFSPNCDYMESCVYKCANRDIDGDIMKLGTSMDTFNEKLSEINQDIILGIVRELFAVKYIYDKDALVNDIRDVRVFLDEEIDVALDKVANNESFIVRDTFDRVGYVVNVGTYYIYQPSEINDLSTGVFGRITPVDNKLSRVTIHVDPPTDQMAIADGAVDGVGNAHIEFYNRYFYIETYSNKTDVDHRNDVDNLVYEYLAYNVLKENAVEYNRKTANLCLLEYMFDRTTIVTKLAILNDIWKFRATPTGEFQENLVECVMNYGLKKDGTQYFVFETNGTYSVVIFEGGTWVQDDSLIKYVERELMEKKEVSIEDFSGKFNTEYIGLMMFVESKKTSKDSRMDFKMKMMGNKKSRSFSGLDYLKTFKIDMINRILYGGKEIIPEKISKNEKFYNFYGKDSKFRVRALTVLIEYTYRYYDKTTVRGKRWFIDPLEAVMSKRGDTIVI